LHLSNLRSQISARGAVIRLPKRRQAGRVAHVEVRFFSEPGPFIGVARDFIQAEPFSTNVIAVQASSAASGAHGLGPENRWFVVSGANRAALSGGVAGVAMHTPPYNLFISRMPAAAAEALARFLSEAGRSLPGVSGEARAVAGFSKAWEAFTGARSSAETSMRMYRLAGVQAPRGVPGRARLGEPRDLELVKGWLSAFEEEAHPNGHRGDVATLAATRLATGQLTLWEDPEPVSLAACSIPAWGVARVGPVYTPPSHRHHGYASALTAEVSRKALAGGAADVVLYADLANATANSIYQAIGYVAHHDAEERAFSAIGAGT
jgi:predicted GNAT family acetyltransferase